MPRRRHEERSSSSSSSSSFSSPSPWTERRSASSPRPTAARSQSSQTSGRKFSYRPSSRPAPATASVAASAAARSQSPRTGRSSARPSPRPAPATAPVAAPASRTPPEAQPASAPRQSPRTESSTSYNSYRASSADDDSYKASSDGEYSMSEGMLRGLRRSSSDDRARSNYSSRATNDGENLFGTMIRALICPRPVVDSEVASTPVEAPVAVPVSPCDTQAKALQDCLHDFETDISKCQFYMNVVSVQKVF